MSARRNVAQLLAGFGEGDAISNEARELHRVFGRLSIDSEIFAVDDRIAPGARALCRPLSEFRRDGFDLVIHHYGIASPATESFLGARGKKVLIYHNITPSDFFRGFDDDLVSRLDRARTDLAAVAAKADAVWADSRFNASELAALGVKGALVLPLVFAAADFELAPDARVLEKLGGPMTNILFVGRIAPNKNVEDLIVAFAWYNRLINPFSRLLLVGSRQSAPRYFAMLRMLAGELDLPNVCFEDFASPAGLAAYYRAAHVFVTASRHEGYCLPLVEAMFRDVPVVARATGGIPEAMGGAGVLFDDASPAELAELIHRVVTDAALRVSIVVSQRARVESVRQRPVEDEIRSLLEPVLSA